MLKLSQTIIVEGRYDKARISSLVDAPILMTDGFRVFRDRSLLATIRRLAQADGIIILTDSDAAGFRIRSYIADGIDDSKITHVYIPDLPGKERRKAKPGAEGKLGVEGVSQQILLEAFARAGITAEQTGERPAPSDPVTQSDFLAWGLCGGDHSAQLRRALLAHLGLPARMNVKTMLKTINSLYSKEQMIQIVKQITED